MPLLHTMLGALLKRGELTVIDPDGTAQRYGAPDPDLKPVAVRLMDDRAAFQIAKDPALGFVETWMDDRVRFEEGEVIDLVMLIRRNMRWEERKARSKFKPHTGKLRHWLSTINTKAAALRNVQ